MGFLNNYYKPTICFLLFNKTIKYSEGHIEITQILHTIFEISICKTGTRVVVVVRHVCVCVPVVVVFLINKHKNFHSVFVVRAILLYKFT